MKLYQSGLLIAVSVLLCIAKVSNANLIPNIIEEAQAEKFLVSKDFQDLEDALIMSSTSGDGLIAKKYITSIKDVTLNANLTGPPAVALKSVVDGILKAARLTVAAGKKANDALDAARNETDPAVAVQTVKQAFLIDRDIIFAAGVPIHDAQGCALAIVGGSAIKGLKKSISSIQKAGHSAFDGMNYANQISIAGIESGGLAAAEALKAAKLILRTNLHSVLGYLYETAQYAVEGLRNAADKPSAKNKHVSGIIKSLKTKISTDNPAALQAVSKLKECLKSVLKSLKKKQESIDAAKFITEGLSATIVDTADAMNIAQKAVQKAKKLASTNLDGALALINKEIKLARNKLLTGSGTGYMGLGAAGQMLGNKLTEGLVPAVLKIEHGRVKAYDDLALVKEIVNIGLTSGGDAAETGILAASQICEAAGNALFTEYADGGEIALNALKAV